MFKQKDRTQKEQSEVHASIECILNCYESNSMEEEQSQEIQQNKYYSLYNFIEEPDKLLEAVHSEYAINKITNVGRSIMGLDVGQPWCIYWPLHTLDLLGEADTTKYNSKIIKFMQYCQWKDGGYGGGHMQIPHLAPTYSAILSLLIVGTQEAYESIDRKKLQEFFQKIRNPEYEGSYLMHENGESDMRAVYIVVIMTILLKLDPILIEKCEDYIASCQTYEGGIGATPFAESHGGYSFCGYAALVAMNKGHKLNQMKLLKWLVDRQMQGEGGFCGRTNKVVDCCYSFWQASIFDLLAISTDGAATYKNQQLLDTSALQKYIYICQDEEGGLFDKPGKFADAYHTCYSLSGYSVTQINDENEQKLKPINSIFNIGQDHWKRAQQYFSKKDALVIGS